MNKVNTKVKTSRIKAAVDINLAAMGTPGITINPREPEVVAAANNARASTADVAEEATVIGQVVMCATSGSRQEQKMRALFVSRWWRVCQHLLCLWQPASGLLHLW